MLFVAHPISTLEEVLGDPAGAVVSTKKVLVFRSPRSHTLLCPSSYYIEKKRTGCVISCVCVLSLSAFVCVGRNLFVCVGRNLCVYRVTCFCAVCRGRWCPGQELQSDGGTEEDLGGEPLTWTESLGSGGPLFYSSLLRWQASALQVGTGFRVRIGCLEVSALHAGASRLGVFRFIPSLFLWYCRGWVLENG